MVLLRPRMMTGAEGEQVWSSEGLTGLEPPQGLTLVPQLMQTAGWELGDVLDPNPSFLPPVAPLCVLGLSQHGSWVPSSRN